VSKTVFVHFAFDP